jgi:GTP-binding protein Era
VTEDLAHRSGFVALAGRPNAGKSTLLNALVGQKLSIVSPKPQTTRTRLLGIVNTADAQVILVDTPGLGPPRHELGRRMARGAAMAMADADVVVWLSDAAARFDDLDEGATALGRAGRPAIVALCKVDLVQPKQALLPRIARWAAVGLVEAVVPISALRKDGLDLLLAEVVSRLPEGPRLYPEEMLTDRPERFLAGELVREQVLRRTREEVPYGVAVEVTSWREAEGACHVTATIHVDKESHKGVLIGKGGSMIKTIGAEARAEIARLLGRETHLGLRVVVSRGWRSDPAALDELGYDE